MMAQFSGQLSVSYQLISWNPTAMPLPSLNNGLGHLVRRGDFLGRVRFLLQVHIYLRDETNSERVVLNDYFTILAQRLSKKCALRGCSKVTILA